MQNGLQPFCGELCGLTINQSETFMGALSIWHILIFAAIALLLFGGQGKISDLMGDVGKGIKAFRSGLTQPDSEIAPAHAAATDTGRKAVENGIGRGTVSETRTTAATNRHEATARRAEAQRL